EGDERRNAGPPPAQNPRAGSRARAVGQGRLMQHFAEHAHALVERDFRKSRPQGAERVGRGCRAHGREQPAHFADPGVEGARETRIVGAHPEGIVFPAHARNPCFPRRAEIGARKLTCCKESADGTPPASLKCCRLCLGSRKAKEKRPRRNREVKRRDPETGALPSPASRLKLRPSPGTVGAGAARMLTGQAMNETYPRDMIGYGRNPPDPKWPGGAHVAVQFVLNYEEGGENNILHGDAASEAFLSEIVGAQPWPGMRHANMESIYEYGSRAGFWRLWRMFGSRKVPATVYGVATAMARNPEAVAAMKELDWEIASHGRKWVEMKDKREEEERREIAEAVRI